MKVFKVCLLGDGAVGKTSLRERFLGRPFRKSYSHTIGADFAMKEGKVRDIDVKYQIWDLAGQAAFREIRGVYVLGAVGALVVFDQTRISSFEALPQWIKEFWQHNGKGIMPVVILGNKADLTAPRGKKVTQAKIKRFCAAQTKKTQERGFKVEYLKTSAKTGLNVSEAFEKLGEAVLSYVEWKSGN
ncbi:MAG: Rab family GTPase [Promethearchaeota archaeon]